MTLLASALSLAELGYAVFPVHSMADGQCTCKNPKCKDAAKHPLTGGGFRDATVNVNMIKAWFTRWPFANIGIATGERSGILVMDVDGSEGFKNLQNRAIPETPSVSTGRTDGGTHYYFQYPEGESYSSKIGLAPGIDVRANGGYVIAPPSLHASGALYRWIVAPSGLEGQPGVSLAPMPDWLIKLFSEKGKKQEATTEGGPLILKEGERDSGLTSVVGRLKKAGLDQENARRTTIEHNAKYCIPPLDESQVEKIVNSMYSPQYSGHTKLNFSIFDTALGDIGPADICRDAKYSDVGNAEVFVDRYGSRFRFDVDKKKWMVWPIGSGVWREDMAGYAERAMMSTLRLRDAVAMTLPGQEAQKALRAFVAKSESQQGIPNALRRASNMLGMPIHSVEFDTEPELLNCLNGTLELRSGLFREANADDLISRQATVHYDPSATAPRWLQFVDEVFHGDASMVDYVQRALGYTLTGITREQAIFVAYGYGANGKSTLLNTVKRVLGDYGGSTPFDTFEADSKNQYGNDLAALRGKRYVMASESEQTRKLAEARVKLVTGQDPISCRFLYGEYFEFIPQFKVWLSVNHKPTIMGTDHGIWRRIHLIPFDVTFGTGGEPMDKELDLKLAEELPGILNWLIDGYHKWQEHGLKAPQTVVDATAEYKKENDQIAQWLEERAKLGENLSTSAADAYQDFSAFLGAMGEKEAGIPTMKTWGKRMKEKGLTTSRVSSGMRYFGFELIPMTMGRRGN